MPMEKVVPGVVLPSSRILHLGIWGLREEARYLFVVEIEVTL